MQISDIQVCHGAYQNKLFLTLSFTDVALVLTYLSYYYQGLTSQQLKSCFDIILKQDDGAAVYQVCFVPLWTPFHFCSRASSWRPGHPKWRVCQLIYIASRISTWTTNRNGRANYFRGCDTIVMPSTFSSPTSYIRRKQCSLRISFRLRRGI